MTINVVDLKCGPEVERLMAAFEGAVVAVLEGANRAYLLILVDGRPPDGDYIDSRDGEPLLGSHSFDTELDARAWVARDIARRRALQ